MNGRDCAELYELEQFALGQLAAAAERELASHLEHCATCAAQLTDVRANLALEADVGRLIAPQAAQRGPFPSIEGFRIVSELGRGGMGVVYEAEQLSPPRRVALKVVRGSQYVDATTLRLFQREIRVLARLEHPGIATLHDAGCTSAGEHWFAMELVRGEPLSRAAAKLPREAQLALFLDLCAAIDCAHQRGVIHRDLKPSNVLVDTQGRVRVLDFGLAKITDQDVAQSSLATEIGAIRGTLAYMSPEQARGEPGSIDLRSDVYSLGVILYELLTTRLPSDVSGVHLAEAARRICEDAPARPSSIDVSLRGDLETIALKALEKEPQRRYASAAALAEDVRRHLAHEPILARAPSGAYQLRKLVARHKLASALVLTIFALAIGTAAWTSLLYAREAELRADAVLNAKSADDARVAEALAHRAAEARGLEAQAQAERAEKEAERARKEARTHQRVQEFLLDLYEAADPEHLDQGKVTAREMLDRSARSLETLGDEPEVKAALALTLGSAYTHLGLYAQARPLLERAVELRRGIPGLNPLLLGEALNQFGFMSASSGDYADALQAYDESERIHTLAEPEGGTSRARLLVFRAHLKKWTGELLEAENLAREAIDMYARSGDTQSEDFIGAKQTLSLILQNERRDGEAEELTSEIVNLRRKVNGRSVRLAVAISNLGLAQLARGNWKEGEPRVREGFEMLREMLGDDSPQLAVAHSSLAWACDCANKRDESLEHYQRAIEIGERDAATHQEMLGTAWKNLAKLHQKCGRLDDAFAACRRAIDICEAQVPFDPLGASDCYDNLGQIELMRHNYAPAEEWMRKALEVYERDLGPRNLRTAMVRANLGVIQFQAGHAQESEATLLGAFEVLQEQRTSNPVAYKSATKWMVKLYDKLGKTDEAQKYRLLLKDQP